MNEKIDTGQIIFGTAEYMKDGLIPLTEWKVRGVHNCVHPRSLLLKGLLEVCFDVFYVFDAYTHANLVG